MRGNALNDIRVYEFYDKSICICGICCGDSIVIVELYRSHFF